MSLTVDRLVVSAEALIAGRYFGTGAIIGVLDHGVVEVEALGEGFRGPMAPGGLVELHCAAKPIMGLVLDAELNANGPGLDPTIGSLIDVDKGLSGIRLSSLLNHSAGLKWPPALHWVATPPDRRPRLEDVAVTSPAHAYSEVAAGIIVERIVSCLGGPSSEAVIDRFLSDLLGSKDDVTLSPRSIDLEGRLEPVLGRLPAKPLPMIHALHPAYQQRQSPVFGGFSSAAAYLAIIDEVMSRLCGSTGGVAPLWSARGRSIDATLGRSADFAGGLVVAGPEWLPGVFFGVTTLANLSIVVVPAERWAAFVFLNGAVLEVEDALFTRRVLFADLLRDANQPGGAAWCGESG